MPAQHTKLGGIYIHIPFCLKKCSYCDFYSVTDFSKIIRFLEALKREMQMYGRMPYTFDSLYIGGGTPSVLSSVDISQIIETAFRYFNIQPVTETTLEANPGTVTLEDLREYYQYGINRLNIGVQSFQNGNLRLLGRIHSGNDGHLAVKWARQAGFDNIGLDLIFGLPGQDKVNWLNDLRQASNLEPEHLSCYMLTCESGTPLAKDVKKGRIRWAAEGMILDLFNTAIDFLTARNFLHYEVSNFARKVGAHHQPRTSRHNLKYWTFAPYIGLGPSAHSFLEPERYWNHRSLATYVRQIEDGKSAMVEKESLTKTQIAIESIYLGLRTTWGIDLAEFQAKFGINFVNAFSNPITELEGQGMIEINKGHCVLTRTGLLFIDSIASMFICHDLSKWA